jgi:hypothetical protein
VISLGTQHQVPLRLGIQLDVLIRLAFQFLEQPLPILHILSPILYGEHSLGQIDSDHRRIDLITQTALVIVDLLTHAEIAVGIVRDASLLTDFFQDAINRVHSSVVLLFQLEYHTLLVAQILGRRHLLKHFLVHFLGVSMVWSGPKVQVECVVCRVVRL